MGCRSDSSRHMAFISKKTDSAAIDTVPMMIGVDSWFIEKIITGCEETTDDDKDGCRISRRTRILHILGFGPHTVERTYAYRRIPDQISIHLWEGLYAVGRVVEIKR